MTKSVRPFLDSMEIKDLKVTLGKDKILKGVNLNIKSGELVALIGQNGAGKSTLLKTILGETAYEGAVSFKYSKGSPKVKIGYVPQKLNFDLSMPLSVLDIFSALLTKSPVCFFVNRNIKKKAIDCLKITKAESLVNKKIGFLSGGELQRVLLALALYDKPDILLLDEPVSWVDNNGLKLFYDSLLELKSKYNLIILLITHDLNLKGKVDKAAFLHNGVIESYGTYDEVFNNSNINKVFGIS